MDTKLTELVRAYELESSVPVTRPNLTKSQRTYHRSLLSKWQQDVEAANRIRQVWRERRGTTGAQITRLIENYQGLLTRYQLLSADTEDTDPVVLEDIREELEATEATLQVLCSTNDQLVVVWEYLVQGGDSASSDGAES